MVTATPAREGREPRDIMSRYTYIAVPESHVPQHIRFDVPARHQGQHIEVAYGGYDKYEHDEGADWKCVTDRSTGSTTYYRLAR